MPYLGNGSVHATRVDGVWSGSANFELFADDDTPIGSVILDAAQLGAVVVDAEYVSVENAIIIGTSGPATIAGIAAWATDTLGVPVAAQEA